MDRDEATTSPRGVRDFFRCVSETPGGQAACTESGDPARLAHLYGGVIAVAFGVDVGSCDLANDTPVVDHWQGVDPSAEVGQGGGEVLVDPDWFDSGAGQGADEVAIRRLSESYRSEQAEVGVARADHGERRQPMFG